MGRTRALTIKWTVHHSGRLGLWNAPKIRMVVKMFAVMILADSAREKQDERTCCMPRESQRRILLSVQLGPNVEIKHILAQGQGGTISHRRSCDRIMVESVTKPFVSRTDERIAGSLYINHLSPAQPGQIQPRSLVPSRLTSPLIACPLLQQPF